MNEKLPRPITFCLEIKDQYDIVYACSHLQSYMGEDVDQSVAVFKTTHSTGAGGFHGNYILSDEYINLTVFTNPYNVGHGVEYHRPEYPNSHMVIFCSADPEGYAKLVKWFADKPDIVRLPLPIR